MKVPLPEWNQWMMNERAKDNRRRLGLETNWKRLKGCCEECYGSESKREKIGSQTADLYSIVGRL